MIMPAADHAAVGVSGPWQGHGSGLEKPRVIRGVLPDEAFGADEGYTRCRDEYV